ncbi:hypothetical protein [Nostocoides veronense]|uniref:Uncharacterized protein n=1 Tax=Nostocoides veronense TaxID=330836 RepID=A0ABN2M4B0_9MICO
MAVLQQLAQIDAFAAVQMVTEDVDDAARVDTELLAHRNSRKREVAERSRPGTPRPDSGG